MANGNLPTVASDDLETKHPNGKGTDKGKDGDSIIACQNGQNVHPDHKEHQECLS
jgi:hypothetical protein